MHVRHSPSTTTACVCAVDIITVNATAGVCGGARQPNSVPSMHTPPRAAPPSPRACACVVQEVVSALISSGLTIRSVSVASNNIGDAGVGSLARLLDDAPPSYSCVLSSLDLRGNSIGSRGCKV